jgi:leucyl aminopeptidase
VAQALTEGALLGLYRYDKLREVPKHEQRKRIDAITLLIERGSERAAVKHAIEKGEVIAEAVSLTRDLITGPSNIVTPTYLANQARAIARQHRLACRVIPFSQLKRLGFGGIVGVAQGSAHPAQFIVLDYRPARAKATFALCGKGITFDTGGISIKPSAKMEQMKYDMSGAAAVLGIMQASARLRLPYRVVGIIAATENMPSGTAQKPGDVVTTLSGKTIEVINTDAEGRLVLSDCLHYAKRYKPDCVVDLATLTGACIVALGAEAIGLMTKNERLAARINQAGKVTHERVWRLPLWDEYAEQLKSDIADIKNVTDTGQAGTVTAAKFLETFAEGLPWAHLDIAGTAWVDQDKPYIPKGAVGIGVRLLLELMERWKNG